MMTWKEDFNHQQDYNCASPFAVSIQQYNFAAYNYN